MCAGGEVKCDEGLVGVDPRSVGVRMMRMRSSPALSKVFRVSAAGADPDCALIGDCVGAGFSHHACQIYPVLLCISSACSYLPSWLSTKAKLFMLVGVVRMLLAQHVPSVPVPEAASLLPVRTYPEI
jgi:hypothetical protein